MWPKPLSKFRRCRKPPGLWPGDSNEPCWYACSTEKCPVASLYGGYLASGSQAGRLRQREGFFLVKKQCQDNYGASHFRINDYSSLLFIPDCSAQPFPPTVQLLCSPRVNTSFTAHLAASVTAASTSGGNAQIVQLAVDDTAFTPVRAFPQGRFQPGAGWHSC